MTREQELAHEMDAAFSRYQAVLHEPPTKQLQVGQEFVQGVDLDRLAAARAIYEAETSSILARYGWTPERWSMRVVALTVDAPARGREGT